jgi:hypothetical protein
MVSYDGFVVHPVFLPAWLSLPGLLTFSWISLEAIIGGKYWGSGTRIKIRLAALLAIFIV